MRERKSYETRGAERCFKRRDTSPQSELFMQPYKEEPKDALETETTEQRENHIMMVMVEEKTIFKHNRANFESSD